MSNRIPTPTMGEILTEEFMISVYLTVISWICRMISRSGN